MFWDGHPFRKAKRGDEDMMAGSCDMVAVRLVRSEQGGSQDILGNYQ